MNSRTRKKRVLEQAKLLFPESENVIDRSALGRVYIVLGMNDETIREGRKAMNLLPIEKNLLAGTDFEIEMAKIYTTLGENDRAIDYIE